MTSGGIDRSRSLLSGSLFPPAPLYTVRRLALKSLGVNKNVIIARAMRNAELGMSVIADPFISAVSLVFFKHFRLILKRSILSGGHGVRWMSKWQFQTTMPDPKWYLNAMNSKKSYKIDNKYLLLN